MGNSVSGSKDRHVDDSVDFGSLTPQGVYTSPQDWNQQIVGHLIIDRKLAPFYRPLEEYDDAWDDDRILASRRECPNSQQPTPSDPAISAASSKFHHHKHPAKSGKEPFRPTEASVYRGAVECPICFLYYPPNINRSRCCDQAICTECFVQIKRAEPTTTHLVSEPAACPYCVQDNFGVIYEPPPWRTGLMKDSQPSPPATPSRLDKINSHSSNDSGRSKRRKSFGADSPDVVTIDQIRPDWEAKLAAVRAAVTRRANRRIIMRQVGDRLIPIGVTSGRMIAEDGSAEGPEGGSIRRRRRPHAGQEFNQILGSVGLGGIGGQDLEELMVMEAMRLSLLEHEEQQRRQNHSANNDSNSAAAGSSGATNGNGVSPPSSPSPSPRPSSSPTMNLPQHPPSLEPVPSFPHSLPHSHLSMTSSLDRTPASDAQLGVSVSYIPASIPSSSVHTHRRLGSSPGPGLPSDNMFAAALGTTQPAAAFLTTGEAGGGGRREQLLPLARSAPQTRSASPERRGVARAEEAEAVVRVAAVTAETTPRDNYEDTEILEATAPSLVVHPLLESGTATASASDPGPSSAPPSERVALAADLLTVSPVSEGADADSAPSRDDLTREYHSLPSTSTESSEPLLDWDKELART